MGEFLEPFPQQKNQLFANIIFFISSVVVVHWQVSELQKIIQYISGGYNLTL